MLVNSPTFLIDSMSDNPDSAKQSNFVLKVESRATNKHEVLRDLQLLRELLYGLGTEIALY